MLSISEKPTDTGALVDCTFVILEQANETSVRMVRGNAQKVTTEFPSYSFPQTSFH